MKAGSVPQANSSPKASLLTLCQRFKNFFDFPIFVSFGDGVW
ncbi:MAG: hypothetical protein ACI9UQ_001735, partial [Candidatus Krumholzibacteriia bacterium]